MVSQGLLDRYDTLADTYRISRSELIRVALDRGYATSVAWCKRSAAYPGPAAGGAVGSSGVGDAGVLGSSSDSSHDQLVRLEAYADAVLELEPDSTAESLRPMLGAHAVGLGFASPEVGEVVEGVLARRFPEDVGAEGAGLDSVPDLD